MKEQITINKDYYDQLVEDSNKLAALEMYGVDNWPGYEDAMQYLLKEETND